MITIQLQSAQANFALEQLDQAGSNLAPVHRSIALSLLDLVERNFSAQGRPPWPPLAARTIAARRQGGAGGIRILQASGRLAASIQPHADAAGGGVSTNITYAAIHQYGGLAGRGRRVKIPARPYLPVSGPPGQEVLQPEAAEAVQDALEFHFAQLLGGV